MGEKCFLSVSDLLEWEWKDNYTRFGFFVNLLLKAVSVPCDVRGISLERGQLLTSRKELSMQGFSEKRVDKELEELEKTSWVYVQYIGKQMIITVRGYDYFVYSGDRLRKASKGVNVRQAEAKQEVSENIDWDGIYSFYNDCMKDKAIPSLAKMTDKRKGHIRSRIKEFSLEAIYTVIKNASESDFLNGVNSRRWTATFDWMMSSKNNFAKVLEGNYKNKDGTDTQRPVTKREQRLYDEEQRKNEFADYLNGLASSIGG